MVREAVEALIRMLAPFAPHTAEELWEMLGHDDGPGRGDLAGVRRRRCAKAEEIVVPVQVNGKVRGAADASPPTRPRRSWSAPALADPGVQRAHSPGKTVKKVVVAKGRLVSIVVSRRESGGDDALARRCALCGWPRVRVRLRAGRARVVPAGLHPHASASRRSRTARTFFQVEQILTEKVRAEFIGRGKYTIVPDATGADAVLTGEARQHHRPAGRLHRAAARVALSLHRDDAVAVHRRADAVKCSGRTTALIFREEYELTTRPARRRRRRRSSIRSAARIDRIATDVARTVVTAILEAF